MVEPNVSTVVPAAELAEAINAVEYNVVETTMGRY
jgi:hypothetical protein